MLYVCCTFTFVLIVCVVPHTVYLLAFRRFDMHALLPCTLIDRRAYSLRYLGTLCFVVYMTFLFHVAFCDLLLLPACHFIVRTTGGLRLNPCLLRLHHFRRLVHTLIYAGRTYVRVCAFCLAVHYIARCVLALYAHVPFTALYYLPAHFGPFKQHFLLLSLHYLLFPFSLFSREEDRMDRTGHTYLAAHPLRKGKGEKCMGSGKEKWHVKWWAGRRGQGRDWDGITGRDLACHFCQLSMLHSAPCSLSCLPSLPPFSSLLQWLSFSLLQTLSSPK